MSAEEIARHVTEEPVWDPRIDSQELAIAADDQGAVTLRGTVGSSREKREAREAAKRVYGVTRVDDQLESASSTTRGATTRSFAAQCSSRSGATPGSTPRA
jgi:hypothetical protein